MGMSSQKKRENQYDLLRLISMLAVIMIHTAGIYVGRAGQMELNGLGALAVMDTASTFAVPCFVMLTGAFTIGLDRNAQVLSYYKKIFLKIGVPTLIFSVFYTLISIPQSYLGTTRSDITEILKNSLFGLPYYHMWYLFMMIGVYAVAPFIVRLRKAMGEKHFCMLSIPWFLACMVAFQFEQHEAQWDPRYALCFTGYFVMGYALRRWGEHIKELPKQAEQQNRMDANVLGIFFVLAAAAMLLCESGLRFSQLVGDIEESVTLAGASAIGIMIASALLFFGFSLLSVKKDYGKWIGNSFLIYLLHGGVLTAVTGCIYLLGQTELLLSLNAAICVPVLTVIVFVISYYIARIISVVQRKHGHRKS